jgi:AcrR family transcriptional regulator
MKSSRSASGPRPGAASRATLLAAATRLFAQYGYEGASVERIASRAKVNRAMVSYHFGGKQKLYRAILRRGLEALEQRLAVVRSCANPAPRRLAQFVEAFAAVATEQVSFPAIMLREVLSGGHHLDGILLSHMAAAFGLVREIIEQGVRERSFRAVDPVLTHLGLIGSLVFYFASAPTRSRLISEGKLAVRSEPPIGDYVRHIQELMTLGLTAPALNPSPRRNHGLKVSRR